jgi:hypothetical protein
MSVGEPDATKHRAALAPNWRTVLAVDGAIGALVLGAGVVLMISWNLAVGSFIAAAGLTYVVLVARRFGQWRRIRRNAGLDG